MEEMRVQIEAREPTDGEIRAFWFTLPIDTEQVEELLRIDVDTDYYSIAFDTDLTNQKAGLIIRKDALDKFLKLKKFHLVWFVNASKEIHEESLRITKFRDWTGLLEYTGDSIQGEYYIVES